MLRTIFVFIIIGVAIVWSLRGPFYLLLFYLWLAYFRPESWVWSADWLLSLNLPFIVGVILTVVTLFSGARFHLRYRTALILLFAIDCILSTQFSPHAAYAWLFLKDFLKVLLISYLITVLVDNPKKFRLTVLVICLSLGFESAKQGWAQFVLNPGGVNSNEIPFLGDNNGVALGMLMLMSLFSGLANTAKDKRERFAHRFFGVGVFIRGLTTYSRGAFLATGAYAIYLTLRSKHKVRSVIGIALVAALVLPVMPQEFWDRMSTIQANDEGERDESSNGRLIFWAAARRMANDRPLLGVGFNCFQDAYDEYDETHGAYGTRRAVHSTWYGLLAELGYPGFVIFLVVLLSSFWACFRIQRIRSDLPEVREMQPFAVAIQGALIVLIVAGTFLHAQYAEMVWHFFALSMALQRVTAEALAGERVPLSARGPIPAPDPAAVPGFGRPPITAYAQTPGGPDPRR